MGCLWSKFPVNKRGQKALRVVQNTRDSDRSADPTDALPFRTLTQPTYAMEEQRSDTEFDSEFHKFERISNVYCVVESRKSPKGRAVEKRLERRSRSSFRNAALCKRVCFGRYHELGFAHSLTL